MVYWNCDGWSRRRRTSDHRTRNWCRACTRKRRSMWSIDHAQSGVGSADRSDTLVRCRPSGGSGWIIRTKCGFLHSICSTACNCDACDWSDDCGIDVLARCRRDMDSCMDCSRCQCRQRNRFLALVGSAIPSGKLCRAKCFGHRWSKVGRDRHRCWNCDLICRRRTIDCARSAQRHTRLQSKEETSATNA